MSTPMLKTVTAAILGLIFMVSPSGAARAGTDDGIVRTKSGHSMPETINA
jgi:hypothetical protein